MVSSFDEISPGILIGCIVLLLVYTLYMLLLSIAVFYGYVKLHRNKIPSSLETLPGVSILKPLCGADANLYLNLESFFTLDYPLIELLFCIEDSNDTAVMIVQSLMIKYPNVDAQLLIGAVGSGVNPKINNMCQGYKVAKYEWVCISDASILADSHQIMDMVCQARDNVGVVHQIPSYIVHEGFSAAIQQVYFSTDHAKPYLYLSLLGVPATNGMSCLYRKSVIDEVGGLKTFGQYLAEDFFLAKHFDDKGWKVVLGSLPARQNPAHTHLNGFRERMIRWSKLRYSMLPYLIILEPLGFSYNLGMLSSFCASVLFFDYVNPACMLLCHLLVWFLTDYCMFRTLNNGPPKFSRIDYFVAWFFSQLLLLPTWFRALANPRIVWRGRVFRLRFGGTVEELPPLVCHNLSKATKQ